MPQCYHGDITVYILYSLFTFTLTLTPSSSPSSRHHSPSSHSSPATLPTPPTSLTPPTYQPLPPPNPSSPPTLLTPPPSHPSSPWVSLLRTVPAGVHLSMTARGQIGHCSTCLGSSRGYPWPGRTHCQQSEQCQRHEPHWT